MLTLHRPRVRLVRGVLSVAGVRYAISHIGTGYALTRLADGRLIRVEADGESLACDCDAHDCRHAAALLTLRRRNLI